jgi:predicted metal-binding protein
MAIQERAGVFRKYPRNEPLEVVGFIPCGGCPGERPTNYITLHSRAGDWNEKLQEYLQPLVDDPQASDRYDSTRPSFLK